MLRRNSFLIISLAAVFAVWSLPFSLPRASGQQPDIDIMLEGLNHPCGVAVHPESGTVYISDSGHGKVICLVDETPSDVVTGFPVELIGADFDFHAGPLGISFTSRNQLVVGTGCWNSGLDRVSIFDLEEVPRSCDDETLSRSIKSTGAEPEEGDFFAIASSGDFSFVVGRGDPAHGWVHRLEWKKNGKLEFKRFIDTRSATKTGLPTALTISPDGFVVVGQRGDSGENSVLAFYDQTEGDVRAKFDLEGNGMIALAYGPNHGRLFALFNSPDSPGQNGLYKLVGRKQNSQCEMQLVHAIEFPLAMAFTPTGLLLVTAGQQDGKLLAIAGLDIPSLSNPDLPE